MQQGQVFELKKRTFDGSPVWAYRYRTDGPGIDRSPQRKSSPPRPTRKLPTGD